MVDSCSGSSGEQTKEGPIDFQVREPASPLFANLRHTNVAMELQVAQEYLGQQSHLVYLPPLWKTVLDFDMRVDGKPSLVKDIVTGARFNRTLAGYAAGSLASNPGGGVGEVGSGARLDHSTCARTVSTPSALNVSSVRTTTAALGW